MLNLNYLNLNGQYVWVHIEYTQSLRGLLKYNHQIYKKAIWYS